MYHYGGNNPIKYTDPTGEAIAVIPFIAPTVIAGAKAIGAWLASLFVVGAAATVVGVTLDAAIDGSKSESPSDSSTVPSPLIDSGVSSAGAMPPSPDDDEDNQESKSSPQEMQNQVKKGKAPKSIDRVDKGKGVFEKNHVHFKGKRNEQAALNQDGTWKHGHKNLTNAEKEWLVENGWKLPEE